MSICQQKTRFVVKSFKPDLAFKFAIFLKIRFQNFQSQHTDVLASINLDLQKYF